MDAAAAHPARCRTGFALLVLVLLAGLCSWLCLAACCLLIALRRAACCGKALLQLGLAEPSSRQEAYIHTYARVEAERAREGAQLLEATRASAKCDVRDARVNEGR